MALILLVMMYKRDNGVSTDPGSIAGLAIAFVGHPVLRDLQELDPATGPKEVAEDLKHRRYRLDQSDRPAVIDHDSEDVVEVPEMINPTKYRRVVTTSVEPPTIKRTVPKALWYLEFATLTGLLVGLLTVIIYYYVHSEDTPFNRFMDSQTHGVRAVMVIPGVFIKVSWNRVERGKRSGRYCKF